MNGRIVALQTTAGSKIIGFDLKWKPLYRGGMGGGDKVAVMQICYVAKNGQVHVLLFIYFIVLPSFQTKLNHS